MEIKRIIKKVYTSQLCIDLPPSFIDRDIEILIIPQDEPTLSGKKRKRKPPVELKGKVKERRDVMRSASLSDWGMKHHDFSEDISGITFDERNMNDEDRKI